MFSRIGTTVAAATRPFRQHYNSESVNITAELTLTSLGDEQEFEKNHISLSLVHLDAFMYCNALALAYASAVFREGPLSPTSGVDQTH